MTTPGPFNPGSPGPWASFAGAVRFLTVAPLPHGGTRDPGSERRGAATAWFPLVGLLLGLVLAAVRAALPNDGLLGPTLVVAAWVALTGGLHEDGWADCADAAFAPVTRARRVEILGDPRIGAHGLVAVLVLLLVRLGAVADAAWWALLAPPAVGRWAMVVSLRMALPLRSTGLAASMAPHARPVRASGWLAVALVAAGAVVGGLGLAQRAALLISMTVVGAACGVVVGVVLQRRLGGLSGDGHGAVGLAAETGALCLLAFRAGAG